MPQLDFFTYITQYVWLTVVFGLFYFFASFFLFPNLLKIFKVRLFLKKEINLKNHFFKHLLGLQDNFQKYYLYKLLTRNNFFHFKFNSNLILNNINFFLRTLVEVKVSSFSIKNFFQSINFLYMLPVHFFSNVYIKYLNIFKQLLIVNVTRIKEEK